jgi:hypothetical protein
MRIIKGCEMGHEVLIDVGERGGSRAGRGRYESTRQKVKLEAEGGAEGRRAVLTTDG